MQVLRGAWLIIGVAVLVVGCSSGSSATATEATAVETGAAASTSPANSGGGSANAASHFANDATKYYDLPTRICAASTLINSIGDERLEKLTAGNVPSDDDAEQMYVAFAKCRSMNEIIRALQSQVPRLTIDQSRCLNAEGPGAEESKPRIIALWQGKPLPAFSSAAVSKLQAAIAKCLTPEQAAVIR